MDFRKMTMNLSSPASMRAYINHAPIGQSLGVVRGKITEVFKHPNNFLHVIMYLDGDVQLRREYNPSGYMIRCDETIVDVDQENLAFGIGLKYDKYGMNANEVFADELMQNMLPEESKKPEPNAKSDKLGNHDKLMGFDMLDSYNDIVDGNIKKITEFHECVDGNLGKPENENENENEFKQHKDFEGEE